MTSNSPGERARGHLLVVGIGASAGGLEALEQFFSHVPPDSGLAYVVIQHLAPQHASMLTQLLGRQTRMQVTEVTDGMSAEADRVYVIAPGTVLGLFGGSFQVTPIDGDRHGQIDTFLRTLAEDQGERAIGIVLSGTGEDGTDGLRAIKEHGGLSLAQSPETAKYDNMPKSAIEARVVDEVLPAEKLPARVLERVRQVAEGRGGVVAPHTATTRPAVAAPSDAQLAASADRILEILRRSTGHDFSHYKRGTVTRRLVRRLQLRRSSSLDEYIELLEKDPQEPELLAKDLLIGVTEFFRDPEAFEYLALHVLPQIFAPRRAENGVRIWVPGCASGEEAYSLGILVQERFAGLSPAPPVQIFATDIDADAIVEARHARYPASIADHVSPERLARFFTQDGSSYLVAKQVREMCVFSEHSLIRDPPFLGLDLISCRNVLIYLDAELQKRLVPVFRYALKPDGYLFLGPSEGLAAHSELFETVDKRVRIFKGIESVSRPPVEFPISGRAALRSAPLVEHAPMTPPSREQAVDVAFERLMLQEYAPPGAVVNTRGDVICVAGLTGRYLQPPVGLLTTNVLDIAHTSLRIELRTALHAATRSGRKVVRDNLYVDVEGLPRRLRLTVRPLPGIKPDGLFAVILQEQAGGEQAETVEPDEPPTAGNEGASAMEQLESELRTTRANLRATVEELESANEELKSSNEEMLSTNEELQSANEELQSSQEELKSVNEEMATVNAELSRRVDELGRANSDLQNLFVSTDVATIFLDREQRLTRFTPAAKALFKLIDADAGRPLSDLAPRLSDTDLGAEVSEVVRTLRPIERRVETIDRQASYWLRILPYRTVENVISGAVVTLADITALTRAEDDVRRLATVVMDSNDAVTVQDLDGHILAWNRGAEHMYGYAQSEILGLTSEALVPEEGRAQFRGFLESIRTSKEIDSLEVKRRTKDGQARDVWLTATRLVDSQGRLVAVATTERDITERKRSADALRESEERLRLLVEGVKDHAIYMLAPDGTVVSWNAGAARLIGYRAEEIANQPHTRFFPDEDIRAGQPEQLLEQAASEGHVVSERWWLRKDRSRFWAEVDVTALRDEAGKLRGFAKVIRDLTERRLAAQALHEAEQRRLERAHEIAHLGTWELDLESGHLSCSDEVFRVLGLDPQGLGATYEAFLQAVHPDDRAAVRAAQSDSLREGKDSYEIEHRVVWPNGEVRFVYERCEHVRDRGRRVIRSIGVVHDITERKRAVDALREADRRKDEFLAVLSHELRNPLAPIRNSLFILDRTAPGSEEGRRAQAVIDRQVKHMARLIDDLLDVTRITTGKLQLRREPLELNRLAQNAVEDHRSMFARAGIDLEVLPAPAEVCVGGDPNRLTQAIGNLLQNAAKFTPRGGKATVSVHADRALGLAMVRVQDTGSGISREMLPRLFEPFSQADKTLDRNKGGLGLGLALVKGLVEAHGGSVRAESEGLGKGTSFELSLPLDTRMAPAVAVPTIPSGGVSARRVLVIEDNVDAADSLRAALELLAKHVVEVAYTGPEGIEKARAFAPDVVLCDIGLPGMDGYEVARALRADRALAHTWLVALTGYAQPEDLAEAKRAGFDSHLAKPPSMDAVARVLEAIPGTTPGVAST